eukprot:2487169-Ditylum_brightwellii.AAC.1
MGKDDNNDSLSPPPQQFPYSKHSAITVHHRHNDNWNMDNWKMEDDGWKMDDWKMGNWALMDDWHPKNNWKGGQKHKHVKKRFVF